MLRLVRSCELPGLAPGASPTFGAGAVLGLGGLVVLDPVDGPVLARLVWARARPPDRRKIAIVADRRFIVALRLRGIEILRCLNAWVPKALTK